MVAGLCFTEAGDVVEGLGTGCETGELIFRIRLTLDLGSVASVCGFLNDPGTVIRDRGWEIVAVLGSTAALFSDVTAAAFVFGSAPTRPADRGVVAVVVFRNLDGLPSLDDGDAW